MSSKLDNLLDKFKLIEFKLIAIYFVLLLLVVFPNYNWFFRNAVNFLMGIVAFVSIPIFLFLFVKYIIKLDLRSALFSIAFAVFVFWSGINVDSWRYELTNVIIRGFYCNLEKSIRHEDILGGIRELSSTEDTYIGRTGAFMNSSHCLFVSCAEEFFYCDNAKIHIYR